MRISTMVFSFLLLLESTALADTHYVDINSTNPVPPYTDWTTAATNIQDAVDEAVSGEKVLIADGHYLLSSEILITNNITIQSVNGPASTMVDGQGITRCFNLDNHACILSGLTITNGYVSGDGGGIYCSGPIPIATNCIISGSSATYGGGMYHGTANNCTISGNSATSYGGGMYYGTAKYCTISGNSAFNGGGKYYGTVNNCTISGNSAVNGGGMYRGVAGSCTISGNSATSYGGGMEGGTAYNCAISGNSANGGGGMYDGTVNNCTISGNTAGLGGGMEGGTAKNCTISGNSAEYGGGMRSGTANNCTISGNSATYDGGGMEGGTANNCIVWYNNSPSYANLLNVTVNNTCSPEVTHGVDGNITNAPLLVSTSRVATNSPCRGTGSSAYSSGTDIDGESWLDPPSMGCDEYHGSVTGELQITIQCITNFTTGFQLSIQGMIEGAASMNIWDFGDGMLLTNNIYPVHAWASPGTYALTLTAYNDTYPSGVSATQWVQVVNREATAIHVAQNGDDTNDGSSWAAAKATIQAGVDAQMYAGGMVWISNGTYAVTSEIVVAKDILIQSVNGPASTMVDGQGMVRCFNLDNHACILSGLTITNGYASQFTDGGGGIFCSGPIPIATNCVISGNSAVRSGGGMYQGTANNCIISGNSSAISGGGMRNGTANNCIISGNSSSGSGGGMSNCTANNCTIRGNSAMDGGGIRWGTVNSCTISGNSATLYGGGMFQGTANNCTISGNSANYGGGMAGGTANNCIVWYNEAFTNPNLVRTNQGATTVSYTCSPDVLHGIDGNITNAPLLVSTSHVATNSPCRGAGSSAYSSGADIDGELWLDPPSMGCDEYHGSVTGELQITIQCITNFTVGYPLSITGVIEGALSIHVWDFGDGTLLTNNIYPVHAWASPGTYALTLTAYNDTYPSGVSATQWIQVVSREATAIHVAPDGNDANDGTSWAAAKATIQAGVDAQIYAGGMVWISNGTYAVTSEIVVAKDILIQSVNGPASTMVDGQGVVRCFNLDNQACILSGLTITNGYAEGTGYDEYGGGIFCSGSIPVATNCVISGNSAGTYGGTGSGGGMHGGTANNCTISGNSATYGGGMRYGTANHCTISGNIGDGMDGGTANNCTISGNGGCGMRNGTANNCTISGNGGGMYDATANNCTISGNSTSWRGGGMYRGTANNCIISGNTADRGGGLYAGTANNCTISSNSADYGGGMYQGTATNCTISGNVATYSGGGMYYSTANSCIISDNSAYNGGGMYDGTANNCTLSGNSAVGTGGGMNGSTANNCTISGNSAAGGGGMISGTANNCVISGNASNEGGGMFGGTANNCTISGNSASYSGGGMYGGTANNCIVWYNQAFSGSNLVSTTTQHTCSPEVTHGVDGNITNAPMLVSASHAATNSPCRGAGNIAYSSGTDIDGELWLDPPSMGCDEYHGSVTGELQITIQCITNSTPGNQISIQGMIEGALSMHVWDFGDGTLVTNNIYPDQHMWTSPGTYALTLTAYNDTYSSGVSVTQWIHVVSREATAIHVAQDGNDANDGASWTTAKATIQAGIDAQMYAGGMVWISNGTYAVTSEIVVAKNMLIQSVNGPSSTIVDGQGMVRCFNLDNHASILSGLTITNGYVSGDGGGIFCSGPIPVATNCVITGNSAYLGGGMIWGAANNCTIIGNSATFGGGMSLGTANNCTISGNSTTSGGGGMEGGTANNCIVWYNQAPSGSNLLSTTTQYTCSPEVTHGVDGNITNAPMFINASSGNFRLQSASPCINAGSNGYAAIATDLDGKPRIIDGTVDMGAYESFCVTNAYTSGSGFALEWMSLPTGWNSIVMYSTNLVTMPFTELSGSMAYPVNSYTDTVHGAESQCFYKVEMSPFGFITSYSSVASGFKLEWNHVPGWNSVVMYSTNLCTMPFTNLSGSMPYPVNSYTDTVHGAENQCFYKIEMQP